MSLEFSNVLYKMDEFYSVVKKNLNIGDIEVGKLYFTNLSNLNVLPNKDTNWYLGKLISKNEIQGTYMPYYDSYTPSTYECIFEYPLYFNVGNPLLFRKKIEDFKYTEVVKITNETNKKKLLKNANLHFERIKEENLEKEREKLERNILNKIKQQEKQNRKNKKIIIYNGNNYKIIKENIIATNLTENSIYIINFSNKNLFNNEEKNWVLGKFIKKEIIPGEYSGYYGGYYPNTTKYIFENMPPLNRLEFQLENYKFTEIMKENEYSGLKSVQENRKKLLLNRKKLLENELKSLQNEINNLNRL